MSDFRTTDEKVADTAVKIPRFMIGILLALGFQVLGGVWFASQLSATVDRTQNDVREIKAKVDALSEGRVTYREIEQINRHAMDLETRLRDIEHRITAR